MDRYREQDPEIFSLIHAIDNFAERCMPIWTHMYVYEYQEGT